jgi:hypothetical protein
MAKSNSKTKGAPQAPPPRFAPKGTPTLPARAKSLIGRRFGRLLVRYYAGADKQGKSLWCCLCDCGTVLRVPGSRLLGQNYGKNRNHPQVSCGCERADPAVRKAARLKVPPQRRKEICGIMRAAVKHRKPAYSMDAHRAAEMLGVSMERIEIMVQDGLLGSRYKRGELWVSSQDVSDLVATQQRNKRRCRVMDAIMGVGDA